MISVVSMIGIVRCLKPYVELPTNSETGGSSEHADAMRQRTHRIRVPAPGWRPRASCCVSLTKLPKSSMASMLQWPLGIEILHLTF